MALQKYFFWRSKSPRKVRNFGTSAKTAANGSGDKIAPYRISTILVYLLSFFLLWGVTAAYIFMSTPTVEIYDFVVGQRVPVDVYARVDFGHVHTGETSLRQQDAVAAVADIYRIDHASTEVTYQGFVELFELIERRPLIDDLARLAEDRFSAAVIDVYKTLTPSQINALIVLFDGEDKQRAFLQDLERILIKGVIPAVQYANRPASQRVSLLDEHQRKIKTEVAALKTPRAAGDYLLALHTDRFHYHDPDTVSELGESVVSALIHPNLTFERSLTERERRKASQAIQPVKRWITEGTVFLQRGTTVTREDLQKLGIHNETLRATVDSSQYFFKIVSLLVLCTFTIGIGIIYFATQHREISRSRSLIFLVAATMSANIVLLKSVEEILQVFPNIPRLFIVPALPLAFSSIFLTLLLGRRAGLTVAVFMPLLAALAGSESLHIFIAGLFSSCMGSLAVYSARTRTQTFRGVLAIALSIFAVEGVYLMIFSTPLPNYLIMLGVAAVNGIAILIVANMLLPIVEYLFGIYTNISLLELCDLNHPLLKRLQIEAPGTYHHTLMVATISEQAAEAIGANALLTRVATYFHDIGKLSNPSYFTENSFGVDRHEDLSPRMSSLIILNHVKEGLAMATKCKLRKPIRDVIASHHGTSLVYYFYHRAMTDKSASENSEVDEHDFRYPGPLPVGKEASIISMADSCEAASRSLEKPTPKKITTLVSEIIRNKILDGQFNDSELNMAELHTVKGCIIKTLSTMLHGRISYPKIITDENHGDQPAVDVPAAKSGQAEPSVEADNDVRETGDAVSG